MMADFRRWLWIRVRRYSFERGNYLSVGSVDGADRSLRPRRIRPDGVLSKIVRRWPIELRLCRDSKESQIKSISCVRFAKCTLPHDSLRQKATNFPYQM